MTAASPPSRAGLSSLNAIAMPAPPKPGPCVTTSRGLATGSHAEPRRTAAKRRHRVFGPSIAGIGFYPERVLELSGIDVEEIAAALADQTDFEHRWLIEPRTGRVVFWTSDTGIDGENPVELDELDLILIDPLPPYVWFQDMADFADGVSDFEASRDLAGRCRDEARSGASRIVCTSTTLS